MRTSSISVALDASGSPAYVALSGEEKAFLSRCSYDRGFGGLLGPMIRAVALRAALEIVERGETDHETVYAAARKCGVPAGRFMREVVLHAFGRDSNNPLLEKAKAAAIREFG